MQENARPNACHENFAHAPRLPHCLWSLPAFETAAQPEDTSVPARLIVQAATPRSHIVVFIPAIRHAHPRTIQWTDRHIFKIGRSSRTCGLLEAGSHQFDSHARLLYLPVGYHKTNPR